jgi:hypothetical protein
MLAKSGNVAAEHVRAPETMELRAYASALQKALDSFLDEREPEGVHSVQVIPSTATSIVRVVLSDRPSTAPVIGSLSPSVALQLNQIASMLRREHRQWLYFDKNLILTRDDAIYLLKPMQRIWWTESQAIIDAHQAVAAALAESSS